MIPALRSFALACVLALPAQADDAAARADAYWQVIADNGCTLGLEPASEALLTAGFEDIDENKALFGRLLFDERIRIFGPDIAVFGDPCPYAPSPAFTLMIQEMLADNGCELHATHTPDVLHSWDINAYEFTAILPLMEEAGQLHLREARQVAYLPPMDCVQVGVPIGRSLMAIDAGLTATPLRKEIFAAMVAVDGCSWTTERAAEVLPLGGFSDAEETQNYVQLLVAEGRARLEEGVFHLTSGDCA